MGFLTSRLSFSLLASGVISAAAPGKISNRCLPSAQGLGYRGWANVRLMLISPKLVAGAQWKLHRQVQS